ncbi:MAG: hypothetical protein ABFD66_08395 [Smithella sp.]
MRKNTFGLLAGHKEALKAEAKKKALSTGSNFTVVKLPWKKSFRAIPLPLLKKIQGFNGKPILVACTKAVRCSDILSGLYSHIGIAWDEANGSPAFHNRVFPSANTGRFSDLNANGKEVVRHDLPMITKTYSWQTPNFGDSYYGYHDVSRDREVYQRDFIPPRGLELTVELLHTETISGETAHVFKFTVDEVIESKDNRSLSEDILYAINLLQENVGKADVFPSDATRNDFMRTVVVNWEILPPGERDKVIGRILSKYRKVSPEERGRIEDRYDFLLKFKPEAYISGTSGFQRYFGAKLREHLVVFENLRYGNAIYVMYENWATLSQKSRLELLKDGQGDFDRIVHGDNWKSKLRSLLTEKLKS